MKLSTKGRYGLRALVDLTANYSEEYVPLYLIANRQEVSVNYLEQVFTSLRQAGIIKSIKGSQGGYCLAKMPKCITVAEVLKAIEGEIVIAKEQIDTQNAVAVQNMQRCIQTKIWDKVNQNLRNITEQITLEELAEEYRQKNQTEAIMYYI